MTASMSTPDSQSTPTVVPPEQAAVSSSPARSGPMISEDWLATIVGLSLLMLVLAGVITKGMVP